MVHLTNTPQAEYRPWFYPNQHVTDPAAAETVKQAAGERLGRMFGVIADQLGDGPWLLGKRFSAADLFLLMLVRWGRAMPNPPRSLPRLAAHARRVLARPAGRAGDVCGRGLGGTAHPNKRLIPAALSGDRCQRRFWRAASAANATHPGGLTEPARKPGGPKGCRCAA